PTPPPSDAGHGLAISSDADNYVAFSVGRDDVHYYGYEISNAGTVVAKDWGYRSQDQGTLYLSYDANLKELYLGTTGYWTVNAWETLSDPFDGLFGPGDDVYVLLAGYMRGSVTAIASGEACLDSFTFTPEPATLALVGLGGVSILLRRRREEKR
ncbi:MAG: PEP-CTERM sorting domain-containing protein, partial [Phycisphaerae bacterium]